LKLDHICQSFRKDGSLFVGHFWFVWLRYTLVAFFFSRVVYKKLETTGAIIVTVSKQ